MGGGVMHPALDTFYRLAAGAVVFGVNDCGLTAAEVLAAAGRGDAYARWRGRYKTMRGFLRVVRNDGLRTLADAVRQSADDMGWQEIPPGMVRDFDLVLCCVRIGGDVIEAPGVAWRGFFLVRTDDGAFHATEAVRAWRTCRKS